MVFKWLLLFCVDILNVELFEFQRLQVMENYKRELEIATRYSVDVCGCLRTGCPNFGGLFASKIASHYT